MNFRSSALLVALLAWTAPAAEMAQTLVFGGSKTTVSFKYADKSKFDIDSIGEDVGAGHIASKSILKALWPHDSDSFRRDTANGKTYFYSYQSGDSSTQRFTVAYTGGCMELWYFLFSPQGKQLDRFTLSETCASDAEDHSAGKFTKPNTYLKVSTWINEYPEKGTPANGKLKTRYEIQPNGKVLVKVVK